MATTTAATRNAQDPAPPKQPSAFEVIREDP